MPQTQYDIIINDKAEGEAFVAKTETVKGVKFVNVNLGKSVVVTYSDDYDEAAFKAAAGI